MVRLIAVLTLEKSWIVRTFLFTLSQDIGSRALKKYGIILTEIRSRFYISREISSLMQDA